MSNRSINPWWPIITGILIFAVGPVILGYTYFTYKDWDEVQASYTESNCHVEQSKPTSKGTQPVMVTYCDRVIRYTYKGVQYSYKENKVAQATAKPEVILVDPNDPEEPAETHSNYISALAFVLMGLLFIGLGVYARIDQK